jgi:NAD(P)-dependent dehydrogenase (short-subunit alcohol dehydrogenase family)
MKGKVVLITGGGTGIGAACAMRFAREGAHVVVLGRRKELVAEVAAQIGGLALVADAACTQEMRAAVDTVVDRFGGLDVLIANAGGHGLGAAIQTDDDAWARARQANLDTAFVAAREAMPALIQRCGTVVFVA